MVAPAAGAVVLVRFPFSDLSQTKLRPAVVLADAGRGDCILCQITSKPYGDARAIELDDGEFASGSLRVLSYARPAKLFTANQNLIASQVGNLKAETLRTIHAPSSGPRGKRRQWRAGNETLRHLEDRGSPGVECSRTRSSASAT